MSKHSCNIDYTQPQTTTGKSESYTNINYLQISGNYGWICPICKRVLAPFVTECPCGGQGMQTWTTTLTDNNTITMNYPEDFKKTGEQLSDIPHCYCAKHMKGDK